MTLDEFLAKWRYEIAGLIFEASDLNCAGTPASAEQFRLARRSMLRRVEDVLRGMFADLAVPPGPIPAKLLADIRTMFVTVKELAPEKKTVETANEQKPTNGLVKR